MKIRTENGQSFWDIAVRHVGDVSAAYDIAALAGCSVTDPPPAEVEVPRVFNAAVVEYFEALGIDIATRCDQTTFYQLTRDYENIEDTPGNTRSYRGLLGL